MVVTMMITMMTTRMITMMITKVITMITTRMITMMITMATVMTAMATVITMGRIKTTTLIVNSTCTLRVAEELRRASVCSSVATTSKMKFCSFGFSKSSFCNRIGVRNCCDYSDNVADHNWEVW